MVGRWWSTLPGFSTELGRGVASDLVDALHRGMVAPPAQRAETIVEEVKLSAEALAARKSNDPLFLAQLNIVLAVLLFLVTTVSARRSEDRIRGTIEESVGGVENALAAAVSALAESTETQERLWYPTHFLSRDLNLRAGPSRSEASLMTLPRNSLVEPIETEAGWLSVRTFEWSSGEIIEGWVYGRYVRLIEKGVWELRPAR